MALADWVLSRFTPDERKLLDPVFDQACEAVKLIVGGDIAGAMNRFNG
jgi:peptidyl-tRNA hydrolase